MCDEDGTVEDYPTEIAEYLTGFDSSVGSVNKMVETMLSMSRNDLFKKLDPLEQAKLDLMSAYALNSMFWIYLVTQGINPKDHGIKQELERIRTHMNKVKEITDRKKAARLDKGAVSRFVRNALWEPQGRSPKPRPAALIRPNGGNGADETKHGGNERGAKHNTTGLSSGQD